MRCAAGLAGIGERTLLRYLQRGRNGEAHYRQFWQSVQNAEAKAEADRVKVIREAMPETWTAAAWWLERRRYQDYAKRDADHDRIRADAMREAIAAVREELREGGEERLRKKLGIEDGSDE